MKKLQKTSRRVIYCASITTAAALVITVNLTLGLLAERFSFLRFDLTASGVFRLDPETAQSIGTLTKAVTIYVLAKEETFRSASVYNAQAAELIEQFEKHSPALSAEYVDYIKNPSFAQAYPELAIKYGDIIVRSGEKYAHVKTEELFNYERGASGSLSIASSRAEEALYTAILAVSSERPIKAAFVSGHGEYTMADFNALLAKNSYELRTVNLGTEDPPPDTDILFIIAPRSDYGEEELEKLDRFVINGGNYGRTIMFSADADQPPLPALAVFLAEWGIAVDEGAVFETDEGRVYNYHPFFAVADYAEEDYAGGLAQSARPVLMPVAKPLSMRFDYRGNYSVKTLLAFAPSAGVRPPDAPADFTAGDAARRGPVPAMLLSAYVLRNKETGRADRSSYLAVSGSTAMLDTYAVNNPSFANAEYLVKLLNNLTGRKNALQFRPRTIAGSGLNLPKITVNIIGSILIFIVPLAILAAGLAVWVRRSRS